MSARAFFGVIGALVALTLGHGGPASAAPLPCDVVTPTACRITSLKDLGAGGTFEVDRSLHIMGAPAELRTAPDSTLTLTIAGDLIVHVGGKITGTTATPKTRGADIAIETRGQILLGGDGTDGAVIAVDQTVRSCGAGRAGNITLRSTAAGPAEAIAIQAGARVTADAECSAGSILLAARRGKIVVAGLVQSYGQAPGTGGKLKPGGGPITIKAGCDLTVADTGRVSSRGVDPGADLVRLVGGCNVLVAGLVESTGPGHGVPSDPPNRCAGVDRPGKPANATACVEIWAGKSLTIDSGGARGEVNADVGMRGGSEIAWIDLFAGGPIVIAGGGAGPYPPEDSPYAVHANQFTSGSVGGIVTVKSLEGSVTLSGRAIQADGGLRSVGVPGVGAKGGSITIEAGGAGGAGDVDLGEASVRARGAKTGSPGRAGGVIAVRSFHGTILGAAPGELDASGGGAPGSVTLAACSGVTYGGGSTPAAIVPPDSCDGAPTLPAFVILPACQCEPTSRCVGPTCPCTGPDCPCVGPDCPCVGPNCPCTGPDCPCVGPNCPCVGPNCPSPCLGAQCQPSSFCARGTVQAVLHPVTGRFPGNLGPDVIVDGTTGSIQTALDTVTDTNGDGYTIVGVFASPGGITVPGVPVPFGATGEIKQEFVIDRFYDKPFALIGCGVTVRDPATCNGVPAVRITEAAGSPAHPAGSKTALYVLDFAILGSESAAAVLVEGDGRMLEEIHTHANLVGVKVVGNDNRLRNSVIDQNTADGLVVDGNRNVVEATDVTSAGGHGIRVTGNRNKLIGNVAGGQFKGNAGDGINMKGVGNLLRGNHAFGNGGDGLDVSGGTAAAPNILRRNQAGAPYRGNGGNGILLGGAGTGASDPVEVEGNWTYSNRLAGIRIGGTGHQLRGNVSGGSGPFEANAGCQFEVAEGNINGSGNVSGSAPVLGAPGSVFPQLCGGPSF